MFGLPEMIAKFYGEYKLGIFGKKSKVALYVYEKNIEGIGLESYEGQLIEQDFRINIEQIKKIDEKYEEKNRALIIEYHNVVTVVQNKTKTLVFPCLDGIDDAKKLILKCSHAI